MFWSVTAQLLEGLATTFEIFILTLVFALPLGLILAFGSMSKFKPLKFLLQVIIWIIRGTPLMLQLIIIFYGPGLWLSHNLWSGDEAGRITATVVAFSINYACYFSVIFRGGIEGVPVGQREAGEVLGMTKTQIFFKVTLLQMIKRVVPPMSNEIITLVKDTSLARIIAAYELTFAGFSYMKSAGITWPLFYTGVFYLLFVGILTLLFNYIEKKLAYFKKIIVLDRGVTQMAILEVNNIEKHFGSTKVLKDVSFSLEQGNALAIIGSSGSGKTTLLRCLNFLEKPDHGTIIVNGETLFDGSVPYKRNEKELRRKRLHFGMVFQSFNLFPQYTALENVMLARQMLAKEEPDFKARKKEIYQPSFIQIPIIPAGFA